MMSLPLIPGDSKKLRLPAWWPVSKTGVTLRNRVALGSPPVERSRALGGCVLGAACKMGRLAVVPD